MVNKVILIGNLGKDPELRYTPKGDAVCDFSLAVVTGYGEKKTTEWVNIVAWKKTAEACAQYLSKGSKVYVEGRLQTRSWESEGNKQYKTEVIAEAVKFLDTKKDAGKGEEYEPAPVEHYGDLEPF